MYEDFTLIKGKEPGPVSVILAGVHGNETCGIEAFKELLPTLEIERGEVYFGYGNPKAIEQGVRFTEANLNRLFKKDSELSESNLKSYEYQRAQSLKKYFDKADALLDVHASSIPESRTFVVCEANAVEIVKFLPTDLVVSGFDGIEPGGTDYYMNMHGKIGLCIECGHIGDPESVEMAKESIINFLKARNHITNDLTPQKQSYIRMFKIYLTKTDNFTLSKPFKNFESVEKNQIIGTDGKEEIRAKKQSVILFAHNRNRIDNEAFLLGEKQETLFPDDYATQFIGKEVEIEIDRPLGSRHPKHGFTYEVNYGFIPNTKAPDGKEVDAYILGVNEPVDAYTGKCVAVIHRLDDADDKLIIVPKSFENISDEEIRELTHFQEQFFTSEIIR